MTLAPFHLAFPVYDIDATRRFYAEVLGCDIGRQAERWIDFDFFGHQLSAHLTTRESQPLVSNEDDRQAVPARHFGVVLPPLQWDQLVARLTQQAIDFYIEPYTRFAGQVGEQRTFFIKDPSDNYLEFKSFPDQTAIFTPSPST